MPRSPEDKFPLINIRRIIRELYFKFDDLSSDEFDALVDELSDYSTSMKSIALERRNERADNPGPPTGTPERENRA